MALGRRLQAVQSSVDVDPDFRAGLRAMLLATAEREGIGATASADPVDEGGSERTSPIRSPRGSIRPAPRGQRTRARARGAIVIGVAAGAIAVSGMSAASENAIPGDALYGMKRSTERAQLALASSDLSRGQLFLDFARTRLAEAVAVRGDSVGFAAVLDDMDADARQGIKLLTTSAVQRKNAVALDVIDHFLDQQRQPVAGLLDGATWAERDRAAESLTLLDTIKRRADGLRVSLACDAGATGRADALGPTPRGCAAAGRSPTGGSPGTSQEGSTGDRAPEQPQPRTERTEPPPPDSPPTEDQPTVKIKPSDPGEPASGGGAG